MQRTTLTTLVLALGLALSTSTTHGAEIGHYGPGLPNIRDFVVPAPGVYGVLYNYFYLSDRLNDGDGNEVNSVTINPRRGPGVTLDVDVDLDTYVLAPVFIWVSPWKLLGAKYGAYITPIVCQLERRSGAGHGDRPRSRCRDVGVRHGRPLCAAALAGLDTHPLGLRLGLRLLRPGGQIRHPTVPLPGGATVTAEAADNIGLGFWTHQLQGVVTWYPWAHKATAVVAALTYEIHGNKEDFDLTPGQNLTLNWGLSQFLPLQKDQKLLLEIGPAGYSSWQITDDSGSDARNPNVHDQVHAVGGSWA